MEKQVYWGAEDNLCESIVHVKIISADENLTNYNSLLIGIKSITIII